MEEDKKDEGTKEKGGSVEMREQGGRREKEDAKDCSKEGGRTDEKENICPTKRTV